MDSNIFYNMKAHLDSCESEVAIRLLKVILTSGYRIGEVLNSYMFFDDTKQNIIIRGIAEKSKVFKSNYRGHISWIPSKIHADIWKSNTLKNYFKLDMGFIDDIISTAYDEPVFPFKMSYSSAYKLLAKAMPPSMVYYFKSKREVPVIVESKVSYHFYRKAFVSKMIGEEKGDYMKVVNYMRWANVNQILFYSKLYQEDDMVGARDIFYSSKFDRGD